MGTDHKEKLIRVLQILEKTDEKSPMNATQILKYLEEEYQIEQVDRRSVPHSWGLRPQSHTGHRAGASWGPRGPRLPH